MSSQIFVAKEVLAANKVGDVKSGNKLIEKYRKLTKSPKLFKLRNLKGKKLFKS